MNKRFSLFCTGLSTLSIGLGVIASAHAQAGPPPPPPPLAFPSGPQQPGQTQAPTQTPPTVVFPNAEVQAPSFTAGPTVITVDAAARRHDISPLIYSVSAASPAQLKALNTTLNSQQVGPGLLDFHTVQIGALKRVFSDDASPETQALRNRSTRLLWDSRYSSPRGGGANINTGALIPSLKSRLSAYPPGTKAGLTNYSWGAENSIGGATAQADVLGIFGREGLDLATRTVPDAATPTFKAMQMYRNFDGRNAAFGSISVSDTAPNPDTISSFASVRRSDGALTIMVINKSLTGPMPISLAVSHFIGTAAFVWQLTSANKITHLPNADLQSGQLSAVLPGQSVTLFVIPGQTAR